jgi:hypothetical protein
MIDLCVPYDTIWAVASLRVWALTGVPAFDLCDKEIDAEIRAAKELAM